MLGDLFPPPEPKPNVENIEDYRPNEQEKAVEPRYEGDTILTLLDGNPVPLDRLLRETRGLKQVVNSFPRASVVSIRMSDNDSAKQFFDAMYATGMNIVYGQLECFELQDTGAMLRITWDA